MNVQIHACSTQPLEKINRIYSHMYEQSPDGLDQPSGAAVTNLQFQRPEVLNPGVSRTQGSRGGPSCPLQLLGLQVLPSSGHMALISAWVSKGTPSSATSVSLIRTPVIGFRDQPKSTTMHLRSLTSSHLQRLFPREGHVYRAWGSGRGHGSGGATMQPTALAS